MRRGAAMAIRKPPVACNGMNMEVLVTVASAHGNQICGAFVGSRTTAGV